MTRDLDGEREAGRRNLESTRKRSGERPLRVAKRSGAGRRTHDSARLRASKSEPQTYQVLRNMKSSVSASAAI